MSRQLWKPLAIVLKPDIFVCYITKHVIRWDIEYCYKRFTRWCAALVIFKVAKFLGMHHSKNECPATESRISFHIHSSEHSRFSACKTQIQNHSFQVINPFCSLLNDVYVVWQFGTYISNDTVYNGHFPWSIISSCRWRPHWLYVFYVSFVD